MSDDIPKPVATVFRTVRRLFRRFEARRESDGEHFSATWMPVIVAEPDELDGGWVAYVPDLPGCVAQGETEEEALDEVASVALEVIKFRVERALETHRKTHQVRQGPREAHQVRVAL